MAFTNFRFVGKESPHGPDKRETNLIKFWAPKASYTDRPYDLKKVVRATYDFSSDGGAISTITLTDDNGDSIALPAGALVTNVYSVELTAVTGGGAVNFQLQAGATDLTDAEDAVAAYVGAESRALASSASAIHVTAESNLALDITTNAATAGKVVFAVEYIVLPTS